MSRLFGRPVWVRAQEGTPTHFVRQFRTGGPNPVRDYVVTEVLARWVESGQWWMYSPGDGPHSPTGERQVWRVEARSGHNTGVYDLAYDGRRWRLVRIVD